nr:hypothetical protein [Saprospiraceae bacterium]
LMIMDPVSGQVVAADTMPDGQETYLSPVVRTASDKSQCMIYFGTGGETAPGSLYAISLENLLSQNVKEAQELVSDDAHGFISPPVLADLNHDGVEEVIVASHGGKMTALDGKTYASLWEHHFRGLEISNSFAVGHFSGADDVPDLSIVGSKGTWPRYTYSHHIMIDGHSGSIAYRDSSSCFSLGSPIAMDLNRDGQQEVLLSRNRYDCTIRFSPDTLAPPEMSNEIVAVDFANDRIQIIDATDHFMNIFSTPWIGDMDNDGYADIVYPQYYNPTDIRRFLGMQIKRISTSVQMRKEPYWGGYQGSYYDGSFR